jgi:alkylhydroperoxidase family enzyme
MLEYAAKLTKNPTSMEKSDVERLRQLGLTDEQILSVVLITCNFNFMTRLADGLGVEVPSGRQEAHERWLTGDVLSQDWLMKAKD